MAERYVTPGNHFVKNAAFAYFVNMDKILAKRRILVINVEFVKLGLI